MTTIHLERERCKSCEFCVAECPKEALKSSENLNSGGYHYVDVDEEKCTYCGLCYIVCPDGVFEIRES
jgi:2-oxoglutarate ferredoxin oxidoreductase subunit delta